MAALCWLQAAAERSLISRVSLLLFASHCAASLQLWLSSMVPLLRLQSLPSPKGLKHETAPCWKASECTQRRNSKRCACKTWTSGCGMRRRSSQTSLRSRMEVHCLPVWSRNISSGLEDARSISLHLWRPLRSSGHSPERWSQSGEFSFFGERRAIELARGHANA